MTSKEIKQEAVERQERLLAQVERMGGQIDAIYMSRSQIAAAEGLVKRGMLTKFRDGWNTYRIVR